MRVARVLLIASGLIGLSCVPGGGTATEAGDGAFEGGWHDISDLGVSDDRPLSAKRVVAGGRSRAD